jgi:hypothetical protein
MTSAGIRYEPMLESRHKISKKLFKHSRLTSKDNVRNKINQRVRLDGSCWRATDGLCAICTDILTFFSVTVRGKPIQKRAIINLGW